MALLLINSFAVVVLFILFYFCVEDSNITFKKGHFFECK